MTLRYTHLLGHEFLFGERDCYSLLRDFYKDNFGIELPNYSRPSEFWKHGLDLYRQRYTRCGFKSIDVHPSEYLPGDVVLMAIRSSVANHAGVLIGNGRMIHHIPGKFSEEVMYRDIWMNTTVGILRHKEAKVETREETLHMSDYLSPKVYESLRDLQQTP